ncbi:hypothetical protein [Tsukamurella paurometabola]|uniref:hypothetical protein n=1 Tax=Tsukamurella paurometabola TaxID=2061 RepID=UPI000F7DFC4B|nr:hypothetical protein [Tsukamurella paurometabola]UEA82646.1 hypothetical protein LK411_20125 [Tsukamurella paurometabola]
MSEIRRVREPRRDAARPAREVRVSTMLPDGELLAIPLEPPSRRHDADRLGRASARPPRID